MNVATEPWCKVCGITLVEDALQAAEAGFDALGFNFYPKSARYITPESASEICVVLSKQYPNVRRVGLFVNAEKTEVYSVLSKVDIDLLQFHGDENPEFCRQFSTPYIKVIGVTAATDVEAYERSYIEAWALLLDTHDPQLKGGTGRAFDWSLWPTSSTKPLILAGGLTPENVAQAIGETRPYGVDVAGGVESVRKGVKDRAKVNLFVENAKHG